MIVLVVFGLAFVVTLCITIPLMIYRSDTAKNWDRQIANNGFTVTRMAGALRIDDKNKKWYVNDSQHKPIIYDFSEVINSKIEESSLFSKVQKLGVYIYTRTGGALYIPVLSSETNRNSFLYSSSHNTANQINSMLQSIISSSQIKSLDIPNIANGMDDIEEQLKKLKQMFDSGLITENEFEAKKKQILGL